MISPFAKTHGLYFDRTNEPENQEYEINKALVEQSEKEGKLVVYIGGNDDDAMKYYEAKYSMMKECEDFNVSQNFNDGKLHLQIIKESESMFI